MGIWTRLLTICYAAPLLFGQQILCLDRGGIVIYKNNIISTVGKEKILNESMMEYEGKIFPYSGQLYLEMKQANSIKFNVINHIRLNDGNLLFDETPIYIDAKVLRIDSALRWGELVACIGIIPHVSTRWTEADTAGALIVFSPRTAMGAYQGLYIGNKIPCSIWLLDPLARQKTSKKSLRDKRQNSGQRKRRGRPLSLAAPGVRRANGLEASGVTEGRLGNVGAAGGN